MAKPNLYIGLMSGTSVDGIDCALVDCSGATPKLKASLSHDMPADLRDNILTLCKGTDIELELFGRTHVRIGQCFAQAVKLLLDREGLDAEDITAIGSHGQTIFHSPLGENAFTLQIGDGNTIAQLTGITTVTDLRGRDMTVGGQGAPLAPLFHRHCFMEANENRAIVNIGGISNITLLHRDNQQLAYDTGPGNVLMDYWIGKCRQQRYDESGQWAASGTVCNELLNNLRDEDYFGEEPPKSTGRELFNGPWLEAKLQGLASAPNAEDVMATLLEFTASTIVNEIDRHGKTDTIFVCGGGAQNATLMARIDKLAGATKVTSTDVIGVHPDWVEAIAFAWLAQQNIEGIPLDTRLFTGATEPVILGAVYK